MAQHLSSSLDGLSCSARHGSRDGRISRFALLTTIVFGMSLVACAGRSAPGPKHVSQSFVDAVARNDVDAAYQMLDEQSRRELGRDGVRELLAREKKEIAELGKQLPKARIRQRAVFHAADGEQLVLRFERGGYLLEQVPFVTEGAQSPVDALAKLRSALMRRSFASILPLLSHDTRTKVEAELRSFVDALEDPDTLDVRVQGPRAAVPLPNGSTILLEKEDDLWWIDSIR